MIFTANDVGSDSNLSHALQQPLS